MYADRLFKALERNEPARGQLLIAAPGMRSSEFARSVVLILEHNAEMTFGVVLTQRSEARARKDWATADSIRDVLTHLGLVIEDTPDGARWSLD